MKYINIENINNKCSQIVLGTSFFRPELKDLVFELIDTYLEHGGNVLDTSRVYGVGESEKTLSMWLKNSNRNDVTVISKGCHHYVDSKGVHYPEKKRVKPECITEDLMFSLDNMSTDYFDIFLLHRDDPQVPVGELMDQLEEHKKAGLINAYGVSNWTCERIDEAIAYANKKGYTGIELNSPSLSLAKISTSRWEDVVYADDDCIRWHEKNKLPLFSWAAQASGFFYFASKFKPDEFPNPEIARVYYNADNLKRLDRAISLAEKMGRGVSATNIALAYVLNQPFPVCAVVGPQNVKELLASMDAANIQLSEKERLWLNLKID